MLHYVQISGNFDDGTDSPLSGTATFTPNTTVYAGGIPVLTPDNPIQAQIVAGQLKSASGGTLQLLATDNAGLTFVGQTGFLCYEVQVSAGGNVLPAWSFMLPYGTLGAGPVDLYSLANTPASGGGGSGTVTSVAVQSANGFAGTVASSTTAPQITLETTVTGLLKGNGTAVSAAAAGTDYAPATSGTALLKGSGSGGFASAASGTDYAPATSGAAILKGNGSGGFAAAAAGTDYLAPGGSGSALTGLTESQIAGLVADLAARAQLAGATFTGYVAPKAVTLTDSSSVAVDASLGNYYELAMTSAVGASRTIAAPSNAKTGEPFVLALQQPASGGPCAPTFASGAGGYSFGTDGTPAWSTAASVVDEIGFRYSGLLGKWVCQGWKLGNS